MENQNTEVIFELQNMNSSKIGNCMYHLKKGKIRNLYTNQLFTRSQEIAGNYQLADQLIHELETRRKVKIKGLNFRIIQCGEINILKNVQSENNRVEFRLGDDADLADRFDRLLQATDVILNPIHTPMGNQGKMQKRREFLSADNRYYFSASNTKEGSHDLNRRSLQYAFHDGNEFGESEIIFTENSVSRMYEMSGR